MRHSIKLGNRGDLFNSKNLIHKFEELIIWKNTPIKLEQYESNFNIRKNVFVIDLLASYLLHLLVCFLGVFSLGRRGLF